MPPHAELAGHLRGVGSRERSNGHAALAFSQCTAHAALPRLNCPHARHLSAHTGAPSMSAKLEPFARMTRRSLAFQVAIS
jgi:hypothetical protein